METPNLVIKYKGDPTMEAYIQYITFNYGDQECEVLLHYDETSHHDIDWQEPSEAPDWLESYVSMAYGDAVTGEQALAIDLCNLSEDDN